MSRLETGRHEPGRHERQPGGRRRGVAAAIVTTAVLVTATGVALSLATPDRAGDSTRRTGVSPARGVPSPPPTTATLALPVAQGTPTPDPRRASVVRAVDACRLANLRQQAALGSAAVAMGMWDKHIEAMNLLVAGKISLAVATDFWNSSRVGAMKNVSAFRAADHAYAGSTSPRACAPLENSTTAAATDTEVAAMRACALALPRGDAALTRARTALTTWEHHIHDMEALMAGRISPAQATAMWQKNWRAGNAQLTAYRASLTPLNKASCTLR